jgi:hypothetical protein
MNTETNRHEFEEWVTAMPYERDITRIPNDSERYAFPNTYVSYHVDLAWEAWQAAREQVTEQRDRLAEALKELLTTGDNGYGTPTDKAWEMAEQALAAVKGGSDE